MLSENERTVAGPTALSGSDEALTDRFAAVLGQLRSAVEATDDDAVVGSDSDQWARRLARSSGSTHRGST